MSLRTIALASTALVAFVAAPAQAGQYMGKVNLGVGFAWEDWSGFNVDYTALHGGASVNVPYDEYVNLQVDVFGASSMDKAFPRGPNNGSFYGGFGLGGHINYKDPTMGALGVFAAVARAAVGATSSSDGVVFAAGIEGEYYCNAWTLSAQIGYLDSDDTIFGLMKNTGFANLGAAYYASSKLKLSGHVGYMNGDTTNGNNPDDVHEWNWSLGAEYLFGKSVPVSTYVEYRGQTSIAEYGPTNHFDVDRHEVRAGVRFYFGGGGDDLQKADREGPSFQSPDLITWPRFDRD